MTDRPVDVWIVGRRGPDVLIGDLPPMSDRQALDLAALIVLLADPTGEHFGEALRKVRGS